ncbi:MAG: WS/DGAT domain-containing protein [Chitinophagales bacterium]
MSIKPLKKIDRIMWDADDPVNPNSICGMMTFKKRLNRKKSLEVIGNCLMDYERFTSCIVLKKNLPHWRKIKDFKIENHVQFIRLNKGQGYKFLQREVSELMSRALDTEAPLWDARIYEYHQGGSAIVFRLHHAIADGAALINVLFSLTGSSAKASLELSRRRKRFSFNNLPIVKDFQKFLHNSEAVLNEAKNLWQHPENIRERLMQSYEVAKDTSNILTEDDVSGSFYKGAFSENKLAAWSQPFELTDIKNLGKKYDASVNDVLLALMAGAVRKHLLKHKQAVEKGMRIVIPVNLRNKTDDVKLHNEIGMISLELPIHLSTFLKRLQFINEKTTLLKKSPEPFLLSKLMENAADYLPKIAKNAFLKFISTKISASITNVPGPPKPVYFAGQKIEDIYCWIPHTAVLGAGLSLISYNGKVSCGMVIDQNMADDPDYLIKAFEGELDRAVKRYLK